jgi:hypothetical protein
LWFLSWHALCRETFNYDRAPVYFVASARFAAQRFLAAATIARLPAAESFRFGFAAAGAACGFFDSAHLFRCASAIRARPAALMPRRLRFAGSGATAVSAGRPESI